MTGVGARSLATPRLLLVPLALEDVDDAYVHWQNDPEVLRYRARRTPLGADELRAYIRGISERDRVFAIREQGTSRHIGNIALNSVLEHHRSAELSIVIGMRDVWGHGYGREAIIAVTRLAFDGMGLHRVWAESPNPAFNRVVSRLGFVHEGTKREALLVDGRFLDLDCWGLLEHERGAALRNAP